MVCEKVNGQLVFIDPQTGDIGNFVLGAAQKKDVVISGIEWITWS